MCTVLLPLGGYPIAVNKYIISYIVPGSPKRSLSLRFPHQKPLYASILPHTRYIPRKSNYSRFYHPNYIE